MRHKYIESKSADEAYQKAPWAAIAVKAPKGYRMFESHHDYKLWEEGKLDEKEDHMKAPIQKR